MTIAAVLKEFRSDCGCRGDRERKMAAEIVRLRALLAPVRDADGDLPVAPV